MKLLLIATIATMPLMGYGRPAQESEVTTVPQIQAQKLQQVEEAKAEESKFQFTELLGKETSKPSNNIWLPAKM